MAGVAAPLAAHLRRAINALAIFGAASVPLYWAPKVVPPASWWFEVHEVHVEDARAGEPVEVRYTRTIHRRFRGEWLVSVKVVSADGVQEACQGEGKTIYTPDAVLPVPLTLEWFTAGGCADLPAGSYVANAQWNLMLPWPFGSRQVERTSNVFVVTP